MFKNTPSYAIVDLFAGVNGEKAVWDVGFYAKNVFDKQVETRSRCDPEFILRRLCGRTQRI